MFVYIRSAAFVIVVTQKLVLQQSKNVTTKCTETLLPPPSIQYLLGLVQGNNARKVVSEVHIFCTASALFLKAKSKHKKDVTVCHGICNFYKKKL